MGKRLANRILLLGWDAADWQIIKKLMDAGDMPYLEKLINNGVMGNLSTLQPVLSPMLWSSIATGKRADKHGIFGFVEPKPDGSGIRPVTSTSLRAQPLWNILEDQGLKSAVVGWFATHPASAVKGTVVSNHFHPPTGEDFDDWPLPGDCISPQSLRDDLEDLRVHPADLSREQVESFIPGASKVDPNEDERMGSFLKLLAQCFTVHSAGTHLAEHEDWDLLAVYYDAIDRLGHEFMECRAPQMDHISDKDFETYNGVIDQAYRFHDMMLGRYMNLVGPDTTIMIVSDHGFFNDHLRPAGVKVGASKREPVRWHRDYGIFVASGPGIKQDELVFGASLLDIAPTTLAMLGLPVAEDMEGRVLEQIFSEKTAIDFVASYGQPEVMGDGTVDESDPWAAQALMAQFVALGYVEDTSNDEAAEQIRKAKLQKLANLSQVFLSTQEFEKAAELLEEFLQLEPDDLRSQLQLAQCHLSLGNNEACRKTVNAALAERDESPWGNLLAGMLSAKEGKFDEALKYFAKAETSGPNMPTLHIRIGQIRLQQKMWPEAEESFRKALSIDGDSAAAFRGFGVALYHQHQFTEASDNLLRAVGLQHHQPVAHYHLGLALMATGKLDDAKRILNVVLEQEKTFYQAHRALADIYEQQGNQEQSMFHRSAAQLQNQGTEAVS